MGDLRGEGKILTKKLTKLLTKILSVISGNLVTSFGNINNIVTKLQ